ncbi:MAG: SDR family oxidoreductase [Myxococcota bacterium]|nr:SDR family oxidoreductase [Myxococcota bacterium]
MASLAGRTCLVTGATSGIGLETALGLVRLGARVLLVGRSRERGNEALQRVRAEDGPGTAELLLADLASLDEVRRLADAVLEAAPALHLLVNNAGVVNLRRTTTRDGFETMFAVNHLAHFLLTLRLLDRLRESAPSRIVHVASDAHRFGVLDIDDLQSERRYGAMKSYGRSKFANILFSDELARRLEGSGVTSNSLHPGAVATRLGKNNGWFGELATSLLRPFFLTPEQGARTTLHVATDPALEAVSGRYFARQREARPSAATRNPELAGQLWERSLALCGLEA